jgi:regulatory subunit for Cdc7p protein kinase
MAKEFEKEWPILFESYLRISSSNQTTLPVDDLRKRAWSLYVDRVAFRGEAPIHSKARQTPETPRLPEPQPYANASGNSVVITSNIASTSNPSPFIQPTGKVAQMSKRVQVLKTNARAYRPQPDDIFSPPANIPLQQKSFMTQEQVITMLQQARAPRYEVITGPIRRANREKVDARAKTKDQDASTGYCENCRMRFTDLSQVSRMTGRADGKHLQSKKHRRFALDPANFASLDSFLSTIARPPNTSLLKREWPPCHDRHRFDARCKVCDPFTYGYD